MSPKHDLYGTWFRNGRHLKADSHFSFQTTTQQRHISFASRITVRHWHCVLIVLFKGERLSGGIRMGKGKRGRVYYNGEKIYFFISFLYRYIYTLYDLIKLHLLAMTTSTTWRRTGSDIWNVITSMCNHRWYVLPQSLIYTIWECVKYRQYPISHWNSLSNSHFRFMIEKGRYFVRSKTFEGHQLSYQTCWKSFQSLKTLAFP